MSIVSVIVVTYNSSAVVLKLLNQLLNQTYVLDNIIVVDNHSDDNTCKLIENFAKTNIRLYRLPKNIGGAGGFAWGFEKAVALGSDKIFTFDDDAYPPSRTYIEDMLTCQNYYQFDVLCPIVVDTHNHQKTSFEYRVNQTKFTDVELVQAHSIIEDDIKLFNGVLFDKSVIEHLEGPRPEFFIRGDEQEFKSRVLQAGYKVAVLTSCVVYHPTSLNEYLYIQDFRYHHVDSRLKLFFSTRNQAYMLKLRDDFSIRKKTVMLAKQFYRYTWFYLVHRKFDWQNYTLWLKAFIFGMFGYMNNNIIKKFNS